MEGQCIIFNIFSGAAVLLIGRTPTAEVPIVDTETAETTTGRVEPVVIVITEEAQEIAGFP
jgi:hypothetical protein